MQKKITTFWNMFLQPFSFVFKFILMVYGQFKKALCKLSLFLHSVLQIKLLLPQFGPVSF